MIMTMQEHNYTMMATIVSEKVRAMTTTICRKEKAMIMW
jgi:hypothetical protein